MDIRIVYNDCGAKINASKEKHKAFVKEIIDDGFTCPAKLKQNHGFAGGDVHNVPVTLTYASIFVDDEKYILYEDQVCFAGRWQTAYKLTRASDSNADFETILFDTLSNMHKTIYNNA